MMSGGIGVQLTLQCVDMFYYSATPLPTMGQKASWTRLVSWAKAAGLGGAYIVLPLKLADLQKANNPLCSSVLFQCY